MHPAIRAFRASRFLMAGLVVVFAMVLAVPAGAQSAIVVQFPPPAQIYGNATFVIEGTVGYMPTFDDDVLWSFSTVTGELLDPNGLPLPAPGTASDAFIFGNHRVAVPGWFPNQSILIADASNPYDLRLHGIIQLNLYSNVQGQNLEVDPGGVIGYAASFPNDTLYSFDVEACQLLDPDGLVLPGNPDRIALAGQRVAMVDTTHGDIMVADVSNPSDLRLAGVIDLPGTNTFGSNDNIVFAADGRTGFVTSNERILYAFDVVSLAVLDPDGLAFGTQSFGDNIAIYGNTVACVWSRGLAFADVSNPYDLRLISNANFGGTVAPPGSAWVAFTADGRGAAIPVVYPGNYVYTFDVATGAQVWPPFPVEQGPNYLSVYGNCNRIGVICSGQTPGVWLIDGLFGHRLGDLNCSGAVNFEDINPFVLALSDPAGWQAAYLGCPIANGDINGDGRMDFDDINPFVALLSSR
ncbi:MAG: hypothetical protein AB1716_17310 [Planctomycetota bacterium]